MKNFERSSPAVPIEHYRSPVRQCSESGRRRGFIRLTLIVLGLAAVAIVAAILWSLIGRPPKPEVSTPRSREGRHKAEEVRPVEPDTERCVEFKLIPSDGARGDSFARDYAADVSGSVVIGGKGSHLGRKSGAAYIWRYDRGKWLEEANLRPADAWEDDHFGRLVAVSGDVAVVSAYGDDDKGPISGSVYVFRYQDDSWQQEAKLLASDGAEGDAFGSVVAIDGPVIVVGTQFTDDKGENSGSGYIFRHDGTRWIEEAKLTASDGAAGDRFGRSVAIAGNVAIFGTVRDTAGDQVSGSIHVFRYDGTRWSEEAELVPADAKTNDWFGRFVDIDGDRIIGGANRHSHGDHFECGAAYIFKFDGTQWVQEAELLAADRDHKDWFGRSVAIHGDTAVVASHRTHDNGMHSGSTYLYRFDGSTWVQELKLLASDGAPWDFFGRTCALTDDWLVVGANQTDDKGQDSGSLYVFSATAGRNSCVEREYQCPGDVDDDGIVNDADAGLVIAQIGCEDDEPGSDCNIADVDRDGLVDSNDVDFVLARWNLPCDSQSKSIAITGTCTPMDERIKPPASRRSGRQSGSGD